MLFLAASKTELQVEELKIHKKAFFQSLTEERKAETVPDHFHLPGAVECRNSITVVFGMLQQLEEIVAGHNTGGNVAGSYHFLGGYLFNKEGEEKKTGSEKGFFVCLRIRFEYQYQLLHVSATLSLYKISYVMITSYY